MTHYRKGDLFCVSRIENGWIVNYRAAYGEEQRFFDVWHEMVAWMLAWATWEDA